MTALLERLEGASADVIWTNQDAKELIDALGRDRCGGTPAGIALAYVALNGSIDAALALAERVLPGWSWSAGGLMKSEDRDAYARFDTPDGCDFEEAYAATVPLAIVAALIRATAKEEAGG